ncbi:hypothetical protein JZO67_004989 [Enterococcus sp. 665A]|uniref:Glycosyltransferase family 1 protein n=2 Tax=Candidatus Enterococcus ferrettii TaxID=2815324 RepID=A0ABV0EWS9_9ENTE|nr:glycosyltransferase family 1 protein [Enterococcus sp. 665A]
MVKRVLHFQGRMGLGGAETFMMNLYRKMDRSKVQFDFLIYKDFVSVKDYHKEVEKLGGRIFVVTNPKKNIFKYMLEVNRLLKEEKVDIVHNEVYFGGGINLWLAKINGISKRIAHSHATEDGKGNSFMTRIVRMIFRKLLLANATDLLAVSNEAGESLFGKREYVIVHNGIDLSKYDSPDNVSKKKKLKELGLDNDSFVIGNIGRLESQKNQAFLIDVFVEILRLKKNSKLIIVGEGSLRRSLEKKINDYGLTNSVFLLGERNDIPEILNTLDVFVMTSLYEGLPMVGIEAQASQKKLVLSNKISKETELTSNVTFLSLNSPFSEWARVICSEPFENCFTDALKKYDVAYTLEQMKKVYDI